MNRNDIKYTSEMPTEFHPDKHVTYIAHYDTKCANEYEMTEYLRLSGIYWSLTALDLLKSKDSLDEDSIVSLVKSCQGDHGGFSPAPKHDASILYTLSAIQIMCIYDKLDEINVDKAVQFISSLQNEDGSFSCDEFGEIDTRFSFCAVASLALVGRLNSDKGDSPINVEKCVDFIRSCMNFDGGFGSRPGSETHSGQIYCCLGALSLLGRLDEVDSDLLGWWLCERQLESGGLNGRPEKKPDVCYSWWVLSSLKMIGKLHWVDGKSLKKFILASQDEQGGGIADRPGDICDPFHTLFGVCGLSLLGEEGLREVNPVLCMPQHVVDRIGVEIQLLPS